MKKIAVWLMVTMMAASVCGCGFSDGVKAGMEAAANPEIEKEKQSNEQAKDPEIEIQETESEETESKPESETVSELKEETQVETEKPEKSEEVSQEETEPVQAESINVLMTAPVTEHKEKNDTKWAEIVVDKELLKATTNEEFAEFCNEVVKDSGYNWVTISCGDGTGIQFQGSLSYMATYGTIDNEGCIEDMIGTIMLGSDGAYSYTESK